MKQFFVFINDETVGPFPQDQVEAKIRSGEYPYDVLIADAGKENLTENDWVEAAGALNIRRAGVGLRMAGKSAEEEKRLREAREEKIDPEIRVKLMRYGLADSISVDKFSPEQAKAAVEFYEKNQKRFRAIKISAGIGGFVLSAALFSGLFCIELGGKAPHRNLLAPVIELFVEPNEALNNHKKTVAKEIMQLEELRQEVAAVEFVLPKGKAVGDLFLNQVEIPADQREFTTATVNYEPLAAAFGAPTAVKVYLPQNPFSSTAKKWLPEEIEERILLNSPAWTNEELSNNASQELGPLLPTSKAVQAFTARLLDMLSKLDCETALEQPKVWADGLIEIVKKQDSRHIYYFDSELKRIATRADEHGNLPSELSTQLPRNRDLEMLPKDGSGKSLVVAWACREMPAFLDKFNNFLKANRYKFSRQARLDRWNDFRAKEGDVVKMEMEKVLGATAVDIDEDGTLTISGNQSRLRNACLAFTVGDETFVVPAKTAFNPKGPNDLVGKVSEKAVAFDLTNITGKKTTKADFLADERYEVKEKIEVGGVPYFKEGMLDKKKVPVVKCSPKLYYIAVLRHVADDSPQHRRNKPIILGVPEDDYNAVKEGDLLTVEQLSQYQVFNRAQEAQNKSQLRPMSKEQAAEYFAKGENGKKPEADETPADDEAEEDVPADEAEE
ncbi:MAG: hypothetical protein K6B46_00960 [Opitutales bacterium]|nr:hypothetical protein [Opitutales bacterium]